MIDPENITDYNLNSNRLEERILFWICAAGKNGRAAARSLHKLLSYINEDYIEVGPFNVIRSYIAHSNLQNLMKACGVGCHSIKAKSFSEIVASNIDLATCTCEELERIYGIGMKTSRCFILHSRKGARHAGLDTHILKYLRILNIEYVPKSTPSSKKLYLKLEKDFLIISDLFNMDPADLDLEIWNYYSNKENKNGALHNSLQLSK